MDYRIIPFMVALLLLGFWLWMFSDMLNNDRYQGNARFYWTLAFVFASLFAAVYYYVYEYRNRA